MIPYTRADLKALEARHGGLLRAACADPGFCAATLVVVAQDELVPAWVVELVRRIHAAHSQGHRPHFVDPPGPARDTAPDP